MQIWLVTLMVENLLLVFIYFCRGAISWQSKLQKCVVLSKTETKYIAANEASKEMLWMKRFLQELGLTQDGYVVNFDSQVL